MQLHLAGIGVSVLQTSVAAEFDEPLLELSLPQTVVTGWLVGEADFAGTDLRVLTGLGPESTAWTRVGTGGEFTIPFLPAGSYSLWTEQGWVISFPLEEGASQDLGDLSLRP